MMARFKFAPLLFSIGLLVLPACSTERISHSPIQLIPEASEIRLGQNYYPFAVQQGGGEYQQAPALAKYVKGVGQRLAAYSERPALPYEFVILNNDEVNAFALPGGKIAINRGLLNHVHSGAELAGVLGHEIAHASLRHTVNGQERMMLIVLALQVLDNYSNKHYPPALEGVLVNLVQLHYSRTQETQADKFGMIYMSKAGFTPEGSINVLQMLADQQRTPKWLVFLQSHPAGQDRVLQAQRFSYELPNDLSWEFEEFQTAIEALRAQQPAYDLNAEALALLAKKEPAKALTAIDKAIQLYPNEGLFYATKGKIYYSQKEYKNAVTHLDKAIQHYERHDYYYYRGMANLELGRRKAGKDDLLKSQALLPSREAQDGLTLISEAAAGPAWVETEHKENMAIDLES
jgi:predicted Zn-dependent protease